MATKNGKINKTKYLIG